MFFWNCENYIVSISRIDFRINEKKIRWSFVFLIDVKKQIWRNVWNIMLCDIDELIWNEYKKWCLNQIRNLIIKFYNVDR